MDEDLGIYSVAMFQARAWSHVVLRALFLCQSGPPAPKSGSGPPIPRLGPGAMSRSGPSFYSGAGPGENGRIQQRARKILWKTMGFLSICVA